MAYVAGGYAQRVLSTRLSNEYQEGPEKEGWVDEYDLPFSSKRPGNHIFGNQFYPVKRPRNTLEASHPYDRQEEIHPRINVNIGGHPSGHLPAPANLLREQAQYRLNIPQSNRVQSMPYHQTSTQPNTMEYRSRHSSISPLANQAQGNFASSIQPAPQGNHISPPRPPSYAEPNLRQPDGRKSLVQPFRPSQNISNQLFQPQNPQGSRASSVAPPPQGHTGVRGNINFTIPRHQSVPPSPVPRQRPAQYAVSGAGASGYDSQPSLQGFQPPPQGFIPSPRGPQNPTQGFQPSPQGFLPSAQGSQPSPQRFLPPSPMQARPDTISRTDLQPRSETSFANDANIPKPPVVKRTGPFIIDDDEKGIRQPESLITNSATKGNTATASHISASTINFAQGRRGVRSLTFGLDDPPNRKNDAHNQTRKNKPAAKRSKKDEDAASEEIRKQSEAYAKIQEKQDMAVKAKDTDALFEEPINEAAQARIRAHIQKEERRKREAEAKRRHTESLAEELETIRQEDAQREKARKEAERAERASKKAKTQEEREAIQNIREEEEKKRHDEQKRNAEELLRRKRQEQSEREAAVIEKEAAAERKRQQDAKKLKKDFEASKLAATSLNPARKGQGGRKEDGGRATTEDMEIPKPPVDDDGGLFVPEQVVTEIPDETTLPTGRGAAIHPGSIPRPYLPSTSPPKSDSMPGIAHKASNIAAEMKEIPGWQDISLRNLAGWRGAKNANTETKYASIVFDQHRKILLEDQKKRDEALAQERARETAELKGDIAASLEKCGSNLKEEVRRELKEALHKVLTVRPPIMPMNARNSLNSVRGMTVSPKKYASETQFSPGRKPTKKPNNLAPLGGKSLLDSEARRRENEEIRLVEKAKKRFEVKLHRDNAEQGRYMSEYEFRSTIEGQVKDYRERREKKYEKEKRLMPHGGGSPQGQARFGYEDIHFNEGDSTRLSKPNSQSDKGRCGGVMAQLRESNGSLGHFQKAAAAKIVDDRMQHLGDDSESEVSEEDPDYDEPDTTLLNQAKLAAPSGRLDRVFNIKATEADRMAANARIFEHDNRPTQAIKPRHLQDKEMVYFFLVQRSEIRDEEKSLPITIKQFFDSDDANEFAEEELRRTRWGPPMLRPQKTQWYSKETGLFSGRAFIDSKDNMVECVDVVAHAQYIGDLDDFEHEKVRGIFKPKLYVVLKLITKKVQTPLGTDEDDASENEAVEQNMETDENEEAEQNLGMDQNGESTQPMEAERIGETEQAMEADQARVAEQATEIYQNGEAKQATETDQSGEAKQTMETDQNGDEEQGMDTDQKDNEESNDHQSEKSGESGGDEIDALFEEEAEVELSDNSGHILAADVHQLSLDSESLETKPEMILTQTFKMVDVYTDRELANKRASEIFLAEIRPVGGDISQLVEFQNEAEKPVRESLESHNISGELFSASNNYANSGEEIRVWSRQTPQIARVSRSFTTTRYSRASPPNSDKPAASSLKPTDPLTGSSSSASPTTESESGQTSKLAADGLAALSKTAGTYSAYGVAEVLYRQCAAQADYSIPEAAMEDEEMPKTADGEDLGQGAGWWHTELGLPPTFSTWSQVTMLHMYLLTVRLRCFPASTSSIYQQHLIDHFFYDAEHRMVVSHNMEARGTRNKYLKDLFIQWRGILFAYDEGLVRGDAALASAVWRNVWKGREDVDVKGLAKVIAYMRKSLMDLEATEELEMQMGNWKWSDPDALKVLVGKKSPMIDQPFTEGTEAVGDAKSV
ncbi:hypothetical protein V501_06957 [Pseudogymnoascus sp. VKM F-4519 (FW-2642)]|nr:hypothetical protein V501_06957 [Pseudogymnoascus sp. VKM F-4519 (FW-2642)]